MNNLWSNIWKTKQYSLKGGLPQDAWTPIWLKPCYRSCAAGDDRTKSTGTWVVKVLLFGLHVFLFLPRQIMNIVFGLTLSHHWAASYAVDRAPAWCSGGLGFDSCQGLRFFLCSTLVSCWSNHLSQRTSRSLIVSLNWRSAVVFLNLETLFVFGLRT